MTEKKLTHADEKGNARMVDVGEKEISRRTAEASGRIIMKPDTLQMIRDYRTKKGDVVAAARIAGIQAAKKTWDLVPLCHPISLDSVEIDIFPEENNSLIVKSTVQCTARTGVEIEALTAVSVALLTVYDMCKSVDREMEITEIKLQRKSGGRSGEYVRT